MDAAARERGLAQWRKAVERSLGWVERQPRSQSRR
jgi:hypothetical protein